LTAAIIVHTKIGVKTTFDPAKDAANIAKHGVSLAEAAELDWEGALIWPDIRRDYGEARICDIGYIGARLLYAAFVDRADGRRIISLRKANNREVKRYAET
jgi:uncharacterized protein